MSNGAERLSKSNYLGGLPRKLRIGQYQVTITITDVRADGKWGEWSHNDLEIKVNHRQPSVEFAVDTVIHELHHAISSIYGLSEKDEEERQASTMGTAWTQVYRDNPKLLEWFLRALHPRKING